MNKIIMCLLALITVSLSLQAQEPPSREDRIKAIKVAFIIEELQLTAEESQQFWPIYNEMATEIKAIKRGTKPKKSDIETLSDEELENKMEAIFKAEEKVIATKRKYISQFKKVISIKQIVKLMGLEKKFKRELLQHVKDRKGEHSRGNKRRN